MRFLRAILCCAVLLAVVGASPARGQQPIHSHLFRHQMLTYLTSKGLSDAQIQLISGHESKKSLEVYQHLSLESIDKAYQDAVQTAGI
jgi:site-specific recombinase XerD